MPPKGTARGRGRRGSGSRLNPSSNFNPAGQRRGRGAKHIVSRVEQALPHNQARTVEEEPEEEYPEMELPLMSEPTEREMDVLRLQKEFKQQERETWGYVGRGGKVLQVGSMTKLVTENEPIPMRDRVPGGPKTKSVKRLAPDVSKMDIDLKFLPRELWDTADPDFKQHEPVGEVKYYRKKRDPPPASTPVSQALKDGTIVATSDEVNESEFDQVKPDDWDSEVEDEVAGRHIDEEDVDDHDEEDAVLAQRLDKEDEDQNEIDEDEMAPDYNPGQYFDGDEDEIAVAGATAGDDLGAE